MRRDAPTLALTNVQFVLRNSLLHHELRLDATPDDPWGERFNLRGRLALVLGANRVCGETARIGVRLRMITDAEVVETMPLRRRGHVRDARAAVAVLRMAVQRAGEIGLRQQRG